MRPGLVEHILVISWLTAATACDNAPPKARTLQERSPNAAILPAPLSSAEQLVPRPLGPPPRPSVLGGGSPHLDTLQGDPLPREVEPTYLSPYRQLADDDLRSKETLALSLEAVWRWPEIDMSPLEAEADAAQIEILRRQTLPKISIDLLPSGRMRYVWDSFAFSFAAQSELRSRYETYGHILVWPDTRQYRVLPAGTVENVLSERRADASVLVNAELEYRPGRVRLGGATEQVQVKTPNGTLLLEQGKFEEAGHSGILLCRLLLELVGAAPSSKACGEFYVPVFAEYAWAGGGSGSFEVTALHKKAEPILRKFLLPPVAANFLTAGLPEMQSLLIDADAQKKLHYRDRGNQKATSRGLIASNFGAHVAYLVLDRVRVAKVAPFRTVEVLDLRPGHYKAVWHDFKGRVLGPVQEVGVPGRIALGSAQTQAAQAPPAP